MMAKKKTAARTVSAETKKAAKAVQTKLKDINRHLVTVRIVGESPVITHKWSEKALLTLRRKHEGVKTKDRSVRDSEAEGEAATYYTPNKKPGILAVAIKAAIVEAAHRDLGIPKTLVMKSLFVYPKGREIVLPLESANGIKLERKICEDPVRVGQGATDLRYRPYYFNWAVTPMFEIDADWLQVEDLLVLINRAGFGVGIHEWRPEKGGEYGRFRIDDSFSVIDKPIASLSG